MDLLYSPKAAPQVFDNTLKVNKHALHLFSDIVNPSSVKNSIPSLAQLKQAITIAEQIQILEAKLARVLSGANISASQADTLLGVASRTRGRPKSKNTSAGTRVKREMPESARAKIAEAQRRRWAKVRSEKAGALPSGEAV